MLVPAVQRPGQAARGTPATKLSLHSQHAPAVRSPTPYPEPRGKGEAPLITVVYMNEHWCRNVEKSLFSHMCSVTTLGPDDLVIALVVNVSSSACCRMVANGGRDACKQRTISYVAL
jgi:hypothetical protein